jgi:putative copper export protein
VSKGLRVRAGRALHSTAVGLWTGGLVALGAVAAPTLFATLGNRPLAGRAFGAILYRFDRVELALAAAALVGLLVSLPGAARTRRTWLTLGLTLLMVVLAGVTAFGIHPAVVRERSAVARFDELPEGDPAKARFDALHRASVRTSSAKLLGGLVLMFLSGWGPRPPERHGA